jgi:predicted transcriptional regulator
MYPQEIAKILGKTPSTVIKQLELLEEEGIIQRKSKKRASGGRDLQFFFLLKDAFFAFDTSSMDCMRVKYSKGRPHVIKLDRRHGFRLLKLEDEKLLENKSEITEKMKTIWKFQQKIKDIDNQRLLLMKQREEHSTAITDYFSSKQVGNLLIMIYRGLIEQFGSIEPWSYEDVMRIANISYELAKKIVQLLEEELKLAIFNKDSDPRSPSWLLVEVVSNNQIENTYS